MRATPKATVPMTKPLRFSPVHFEPPKRAKIVPPDRIHEVKSIREFRQHALEHHGATSKKIVCFVDLDLTMHRVTTTFPSDQWFRKHYEAALANNSGNIEATNSQVLPLYHAGQEHAEVALIEPETLDVISAMRAKGIEVYGLTTRGAQITGATIRQLTQIGLSFNHGHLKDRTINLELGGSMLCNGVIFCNGASKGDCAKAFLAHTGWTLSQLIILFIDDMRKHLERVRKVSEELGIEYVGFRYGHMDHTLEQVDLQIAEVQIEFLEKFGFIPTDEQVRKHFAFKAAQQPRHSLTT